MNNRSTQPLSAAKARTIEAAINLFSEHGVAGTSLQMIADHLGITKAAVYHQFKAKEDIVIAVGGLIFDSLQDMADRAEAQPTLKACRAFFLDELIRLAVDNRGAAGFLHQDPVMLRLFEEHKPFKQTFERMDKLLLGKRNDAQARVIVAALTTAIGGTVRHPLVKSMSNKSLNTELRNIASTFLAQLEQN